MYFTLIFGSMLTTLGGVAVMTGFDDLSSTILLVAGLILFGMFNVISTIRWQTKNLIRSVQGDDAKPQPYAWYKPWTVMNFGIR